MYNIPIVKTIAQYLNFCGFECISEKKSLKQIYIHKNGLTVAIEKPKKK